MLEPLAKNKYFLKSIYFAGIDNTLEELEMATSERKQRHLRNNSYSFSRYKFFRHFFDNLFQLYNLESMVESIFSLE